MEKDVIQKVKFKTLDINDPFFTSLRQAYAPNFEQWFQKKDNEDAYIFINNGVLDGFLYLKDEDEGDSSVQPPLIKKRRLKIGTFKINSHGTVLGQRFISIILSRMIQEDFSETYVTFFPEQKGLIKLFEKFGFKLHGEKNNGELVYVKLLDFSDNPHLDYPRIKIDGCKKVLMSIYPKFHTKMFPDARLNTERNHIVEDLSFTNTVEKIYLSKMRGISDLNKGDLIVIYRTKDNQAQSAEYSSVATAVCTVLDVKNMVDFKDIDEYLMYCGRGSIFSEEELRRFYLTKQYPYIIKMLYNFPLRKRVIRQKLIENAGIDRNAYPGFMPLNEQQFRKIIELGEVNESFIID